MGLKKIVSALLPVEYREQVLGDLHERGFRLRDIASVVPQVWWSHLQRAWTLPRFALAGAPDAILQQRAEQFFRRTRWLVILWFVLLFQPALKIIDASLAVSFAVNVVLFTICWPANGRFWRIGPLPESTRQDWAKFHRGQLEIQRKLAKFGTPYFLFSMAALQIVVTFRPAALTRMQRTEWLLATLALSLILGQFRARRLQREMDGIR